MNIGTANNNASAPKPAEQPLLDDERSLGDELPLAGIVANGISYELPDVFVPNVVNPRIISVASDIVSGAMRFTLTLLVVLSVSVAYQSEAVLFTEDDDTLKTSEPIYSTHESATTGVDSNASR